MQILRTAIIGCGGIAQRHAQNLVQLADRFELVAFADLVTRVVVIDRGRVAFDGSRAAYVADGADVLHDHDWHHHDWHHDTDHAASRSAVLPAAGPLAQPPTSTRDPRS